MRGQRRVNTCCKNEEEPLTCRTVCPPKGSKSSAGGSQVPLTADWVRFPSCLETWLTLRWLQPPTLAATTVISWEEPSEGSQRSLLKQFSWLCYTLIRQNMMNFDWWSDWHWFFLYQGIWDMLGNKHINVFMISIFCIQYLIFWKIFWI